MISRLGARRFSALEEYITTGHRTVEGWIQEGCLTGAYLISLLQRQLGLTGGACEIGVHHGRFFIPLALASSDGAASVAVDIFDMQHLNLDGSGKGDYTTFKANISRYGLGNVSTLKKDSLDLRPREIIDAAKGVRPLLFSVDGCHTAEHTLNDINIAAECIGNGGVVIVDDFLSGGWIGVTEGVFRYLNGKEPGMQPFAFGNNKLYLCKTEDHPIYFSFFANTTSCFAINSKKVRLAGSDCVALEFAPPCPELFTFRLDQIVLSYGFNLSCPKDKVSLTGFSDIEWECLCWTVGPDAVIELDCKGLDGAPRSEVYLEIMAMGFTHGQRPKQHVEFHANDVALGTIAAPGQWETYSFRLSRGMLSSERIVLKLHILHPQSPKSLGLGNDDRELGLALRYLRILAR